MSVTFRPHLAAIPSYRPGRSAPGAIKLASNELSCPIPAQVTQAIAEAAHGINRYPDNGAVQLTQALAASCGVEPAHILAAPGSVALCQAVITATAGPGESVLYGWRSFEAYPVLTLAAGATAKQVPLADDGRLDLGALADAITAEVRTIFICTPNNPTGPAVSEAEFAAFYDCVPSDVLIVVDEAYREFVTDADAVDGQAWALAKPNVLSLRTMSKAYALAGLRLGYAIGQADVLAELAKTMPPFGVSSLAQAAGIAALAAQDYFAPYWQQVIAERHRMRTELLARGYPIPPSQANFVWLPLGDRTTAVTNYLADRHILVRAFAGEGIRVTIGSPAENDAFLAEADAAWNLAT